MVDENEKIDGMTYDEIAKEFDINTDFRSADFNHDVLLNFDAAITLYKVQRGYELDYYDYKFSYDHIIKNPHRLVSRLPILSDVSYNSRPPFESLFPYIKEELEKIASGLYKSTEINSNQTEYKEDKFVFNTKGPKNIGGRVI